jgi:hypothetical protein
MAKKKNKGDQIPPVLLIHYLEQDGRSNFSLTNIENVKNDMIKLVKKGMRDVRCPMLDKFNEQNYA